MKHGSLLLALIILKGRLASAHGIIARVAIDGVVYNGPPAGSGDAGPASIVRQVSDNGPVKPTAADMGCGLGVHSPASMVAPANPGSKITFQWMNGGGPWIHKLGPLLTYMAECTGTTCDQYDSSQAKWFKIDQVGQHSDKTWFQADINQGKSITVTLPSSLAAGDYLVRHEIIAMHNAVSPGGAEFYPSCTQIRLSAPTGQTTTPDNIVSFPGAYDSNLSDDSLVAADIYNSGYQYPAFPGPTLSNVADASGGTITPELAAGGATGSPATGSPTSPATSSTVSNTDSSAPTDTLTYTDSSTPTSFPQATRTVTSTITVIGSICAPATATGKKRMVRAHRRQH